VNGKILIEILAKSQNIDVKFRIFSIQGFYALQCYNYKITIQKTLQFVIQRAIADKVHFNIRGIKYVRLSVYERSTSQEVRGTNLKLEIIFGGIPKSSTIMPEST
jgi:hypothetical protein